MTMPQTIALAAWIACGGLFLYLNRHHLRGPDATFGDAFVAGLLAVAGPIGLGCELMVRGLACLWESDE